MSHKVSQSIFGNASATIQFKCPKAGFGAGTIKEPSAFIQGGEFREILKQ